MKSKSKSNAEQPVLYTRTRQHVPMMREGMNSLAWSMLPPPQRLSARDRLGREARRKRRLITLEEVRAHNDLTKDGWVIFENKVYSISRYAAYHPGGYYVLASVVGDDCTAQFKELHPWIQGHAMLKDYLVGEIESTPQVEAAKTLPVLTRGLSQWVHGRLAAWRVVSADKSAVLLSFEVEKGETRKTVAELNNSAELAKHVMFKLGPKFVRPYSNLLTAWPEKQLQPIEGLDPEKIHLVIRLYQKGRLTKMLHKMLVEGKEVAGDFAYVQSHVRYVGGKLSEDGDRGAWTKEASDVENLVLVCAGTGVLPLLAFIQQCLHESINKRAAPKLWLFFASATEEGIIFHSWLKKLAKKYKQWFNVLFVLSKPPKSWSGEVGHIGDELLSKDWSTLAWTNKPEEKELDGMHTSPHTRVVLAGPPGFDKYGPMDDSGLTNVPTCLIKKGVNPEFIYSL